MKKLLIVLCSALLVFFSQDTFAQSRLTPLLDTNVNAETENIETPALTSNRGDFTFQYVGTKLSGTVAGKVYLQGSLDGVNYFNSDSLVLADVTTQTKIFDVSAKKRLKWRFSVVTTGGSQALVNKGYFTQLVKP